MSHLITCPECDKPLQVPEELIGKKVQCPECSHTFAAALPEDDETPGSSRPTSRPTMRDMKKTGNGISKTTKRRNADEDDEDDDDRPSRRSSRRRDEDDDDDNLPSIRRSRRSPRRRSMGDEKPGKVMGMGIMALIGGILAIVYTGILMLWFGIASLGICCLWPGFYYGLVAGILAIVKGSQLLGNNAYLSAPPVTIGVLLIINIINGDFVNLVLGILIIVFCNDEEVTAYMAR